MSENPNTILLKHLQIEMYTELQERLRLQKNLCTQYRYVYLPIAPPTHAGVDSLNRRSSYFEIIGLFGPEILAVVVTRCDRRDRQLSVEAEKAVIAHGGNRDHERSNVDARLKTRLELQMILCAEYRYVHHQLQLWS